MLAAHDYRVTQVAQCPAKLQPHQVCVKDDDLACTTNMLVLPVLGGVIGAAAGVAVGARLAVGSPTQ